MSEPQSYAEFKEKFPYFQDRAKLISEGKYLDLAMESNDSFDLCYVADFGRDEDLDILVNHPYWEVRESVAEHGRKQDMGILMWDEDERVRESVADKCEGIIAHILVGDKSELVRIAVAGREDRDYLDDLVDDESELVRETVALMATEEEHGHILDILVHDDLVRVLGKVIQKKRFKDLNILEKHKDPYVRGLVAECGAKIYLNTLVYDTDSYVRNIVAKKGNDFHVKILLEDDCSFVRKTAQKRWKELNPTYVKIN